MNTTKLTHVHAHMKYLTVDGDEYILPEKAYKNLTWLNSHGAKPVRILAEFIEPEQRFEACNVKNTILFFGSARSRSPEDHALAVKRSEAQLADPGTSEEDQKKARTMIDRLQKTAWMCDVYVKVEELAHKLSEWSMGRIGTDGKVPYIIATGGGPGLMEAANKGAAKVPGAVTAGIAISLPFEAGLNKYVTPELGFQMHYFFSRKFALCWPSRALVVCAGGYGSLDECFEILTLMQSGKIDQPQLLPVVMFPGSYWRKIIDWDEMVACGVISENDVKMLFFTDDVTEAYDHITSKLLQWEAASAIAAAAAAEAAKNAAISAAAAANEAAVKAALASKAILAKKDKQDYAASPILTADTVRFAVAHSALPVQALSLLGSAASREHSPSPSGAASMIRAPAMDPTGLAPESATPVDGFATRGAVGGVDDASVLLLAKQKAPGLARELSQE